MRVDDRGRLAGQRAVMTFQASTDVAAEYGELLHRRRSQRRNRAAALAVSAVVAVLAVLSVQANLAPDSQPQPLQPSPSPAPDVGGVPVWYDAEGLHRGRRRGADPGRAVRQKRRGFVGRAGPGAIGCAVPGPRDARRVVPPLGRRPAHRGTQRRLLARAGTRTATPPSGSRDPSSSSTTRPRAARSHEPTQSPAAPNCQGMCAEHYPAGSNFLQVSAERVVWSKGPGSKSYSHDVLTREYLGG